VILTRRFSSQEQQSRDARALAVEKAVKEQALRQRRSGTVHTNIMIERGAEEGLEPNESREEGEEEFEDATEALDEAEAASKRTHKAEELEELGNVMRHRLVGRKALAAMGEQRVDILDRFTWFYLLYVLQQKNSEQKRLLEAYARVRDDLLSQRDLSAVPDLRLQLSSIRTSLQRVRALRVPVSVSDILPLSLCVSRTMPRHRRMRARLPPWPMRYSSQKT
jgi:hypothetical protein